MNPSRFDDARWYQATTLAERLAAGRHAPATDEPAAKRRLAKWKAQSPFDRNGLFERRLALDGLDEDGLRRLLGESPDDVRKRFGEPPEWLWEFRQAFLSEPEGSLPFPDAMLEEGEGGFLWAAAPMIHLGRRRLRAKLRSLAASGRPLPFDPRSLEENLWVHLQPQLRWTLSRTLALELYVAGLEERLEGETPQERFRNFVEGLRDPATLLAIYEHYPALARQVTVRVRDWVGATGELLERLCADFETIRTELCPGHDPGSLVEVRSGLGDRHRGGRTVHILRFSSGFGLVYKPRPMAAGVHFQGLLEWVNERGLSTPWRTLRILDRGDYGWIELLDATPCDEPAQVERFYRRQGGFLALLYALAANDFHYENLIAVGEHPVLIDLESLFQPLLATPTGEDPQQLAYNEMDRSVLRVGLLPQRVWVHEESAGIDLSGMGARDGQMSPDAAPVWEGLGTDDMRLVRKKLTLAVGAKHLPKLGGEEADLAPYSEAIVDGFTEVYRLLLDNREALLGGEGPLAAFAGTEVRVIVRPTRTYGLLLQESFHPDLMSSGLERDRHFDRLWVAAEHLEILPPLIAAERDELHQGDIPLFTSRLGSGEILGRGGRPAGLRFEQDGLRLAYDRIAGLSEDDLAKQTWFVRASLATTDVQVERAVASELHPAAPDQASGGERFLAAARAAGDRLESLAFRGGGEATWIGMTSRMGRDWSLAPLSLDLYSGLPGVALFLAYLGQLSGEASYSELARETAATVDRHAAALGASASSFGLGGFDGRSGLVYVEMHLAVLWNEPERLAKAHERALRLPDLLADASRYDVVSGAAGCLGVLLGLYRQIGERDVLDAAIRCGEWLVETAVPMETGIGWPPPVNASQPMGGFAHGVAGIAWSLAELAAASGQDRFLETARRGWDYEQTLFVPEVGNWRDVRHLETLQMVEEIDGNLFMAAWCYGAPGIALGRLAALRRFDEPELRRQAETALETTLREGFGENQCQCHGDLGNLESLHLAREVLGDEAWRPHVERIAAAVAADVRASGWRCGMAMGVETPGIMTGVAGIGYGLLRLAEPLRVPCLLLLEPPVEPSSMKLSHSA